ncbi:unnamed protein product [Rotaria socialis]|nr:unnamed protein product [Rotaria socialis]
MTSNYFDDGLDVNNLDDLKIVSTLRYGDWGQFLLQFSLDVVAVQDKELDIQRKRTKGYIWHYRRCYEDIIEKLNRLLPQLQASL